MRDRGPASRPQWGEEAAAGRVDASPDEAPARPGGSPSEAPEPRFRRRGRRAARPRRRARLIMAAAVLVPVAFVLMRARGPEAPPPPPAPPLRGETFLDWMAREDQRRAERNEARFQGWTLRTGQEVDHPNTRQRNRLQRFLDDLGKAFQSLIIH